MSVETSNCLYGYQIEKDGITLIEKYINEYYKDYMIITKKDKVYLGLKNKAECVNFSPCLRAQLIINSLIDYDSKPIFVDMEDAVEYQILNTYDDLFDAHLFRYQRIRS